MPVLKVLNDSRAENRGHAAQVLPDVHPYEVDEIDTTTRKCKDYSVIRKAGIKCKQDEEAPKDRFDHKPLMFYYDGRAYNSLAYSVYNKDPCRYYRNTWDWKPTPPTTYSLSQGHYDGLSKPPVRQLFRLTSMKVTTTTTMPSYEILTPDNAEEYFRDAV